MVNSINLTMTSKQDIATWKANRRKLAYSTVGTPDYVSYALQVRTQLTFRSPLKFSCSRGTAKSATGGLSERSCSSVSSVSQLALCQVEADKIGYPPFCSENAHDVYRKICNWREHLFFPDDIHLSREAEDLVRRCDQIIPLDFR